MSFITTAAGQRADGLWSPDLPLIFDSRFSLEGLPPMACVPSTAAGMAQWGVVGSSNHPDPKRRFVFLYSPSFNPPQEPKRVIIRLQGFISHCDLRPLGDWKGKPEDAHRAHQQLTLHGGNSPAAMVAQTKALALMHNQIRGSLPYPRDYTPPKHRIELEHMVFTKTTPGSSQINTLRPEDDIDGGAAQALKDWSVTTRVFTGRRTDAGEIEPYPGVFFRRNDFVDVTATVDLLAIDTEQGARLRIFLDMQSVILLRRATAAQQIHGFPNKFSTRRKVYGGRLQSVSRSGSKSSSSMTSG